MPDEWSDPTSDFSTIIITNSILFFSDHLYLSYFVIFSPYLLKLASFLSPLLFSTFAVFIAVVAHEKDKPDEEDLGMYDALFGTCSMNCLNEENPLEISEKEDSDSDFAVKEKNPGPVSELKKLLFDERRMESFLKILDQFERKSTSSAEKKLTVAKIDDEVDRQNAATKTSPDGIKVKKADDHDGVQKNRRELKPDIFRTWDGDARNNGLDNVGSTRKEKEWKRTLACKLFEERHGVEGRDGMDSLWEAYEVDSNKPVVKQMSGIKTMSKKKSEIRFCMEGYENDRVYEDGEKAEFVGGRLCCLNVVKFSTGKMKNPGLRKPNLVKISKAISGYGWLHHVSKHRTKVHDDNGEKIDR